MSEQRTTIEASGRPVDEEMAERARALDASRCWCSGWRDVSGYRSC